MAEDLILQTLTDKRRTLKAGIRKGIVHVVTSKDLHQDKLPTYCGLQLDWETELLIMLQRPEDITCPTCAGYLSQTRSRSKRGAAHSRGGNPIKAKPPITDKDKPSIYRIGNEEREVWPDRCTRPQRVCVQCYIEGKIRCAPRFAPVAPEAEETLQPPVAPAAPHQMGDRVRIARNESRPHYVGLIGQIVWMNESRQLIQIRTERKPPYKRAKSSQTWVVTVYPQEIEKVQ